MNFVYAFRVETSRRSLRLGTILVTRPVDGSFVSSTFSDQLFSGQDPHPKKLVLQLFLCQELPLARTLVFDYFSFVTSFVDLLDRIAERIALNKEVSLPPVGFSSSE